MSHFKETLKKQRCISLSPIAHTPSPFPDLLFKRKKRKGKKKIIKPERNHHFLSATKARYRITVKLLFPPNTSPKASQVKYDLKAGRTILPRFGQTLLIHRS